MTLNGNSDETNGYNSVIKNTAVANANFVKSVIPPIGSIISWAKTFASADSGTTDGTTADKLVDAGQNFQTTVETGYVVHNTTDDTFAYVTAVDSDSILSIDSDIMVSGETYIIYKTPTLPDGWLECDGTAISDADSPFNGTNLPDMNSTQRFARGSISSGTTGGSDTDSHSDAVQSAGTKYGYSSSSSTNLPAYYEVVFIMRVK